MTAAISFVRWPQLWRLRFKTTKMKRTLPFIIIIAVLVVAVGAGWYLTRSVERLVPPRNRASRRIEARWQSLAVGDTIPDYGGRHETFLVAAISAAHHLVYTSQRGRVRVSWCITIMPFLSSDEDVQTRVHLRLRLAAVRRMWLARTAGELIDLITIAGMAAGLRERLDEYGGAQRNRRGDPADC